MGRDEWQQSQESPSISVTRFRVGRLIVEARFDGAQGDWTIFDGDVLLVDAQPFPVARADWVADEAYDVANVLLQRYVP